MKRESRCRSRCTKYRDFDPGAHDAAQANRLLPEVWRKTAEKVAIPKRPKLTALCRVRCDGCGHIFNAKLPVRPFFVAKPSRSRERASTLMYHLHSIGSVFVVAQAYEARVPQNPISRDVAEFDLGEQIRFDPSRALQIFAGNRDERHLLLL